MYIHIYIHTHKLLLLLRVSLALFFLTETPTSTMEEQTLLVAPLSAPHLQPTFLVLNFLQLAAVMQCYGPRCLVFMMHTSCRCEATRSGSSAPPSPPRAARATPR